MGGTPRANAANTAARQPADNTRGPSRASTPAAAARALAKLNAEIHPAARDTTVDSAGQDETPWPDLPVQCTARFLDDQVRLGAAAGSVLAVDQAARRLNDLERQWRGDRGSDLARIASTPGVAQRVCPDTVLLALLANRGTVAARDAFFIDGPHRIVGLLADRMPNLEPLAKALAVDLAFAELSVGAGSGAHVQVGTSLRWSGTPHGVAATLTGSNLGACAYACAEPAASPTAGDSTAGRARAGGRLLVVADQAWRAYLIAAAAVALPGDRASALIIGSGAAGHGVTVTGDQVSVELPTDQVMAA